MGCKGFRMYLKICCIGDQLQTYKPKCPYIYNLEQGDKYWNLAKIQITFYFGHPVFTHKSQSDSSIQEWCHNENLKCTVIVIKLIFVKIWPLLV